MNQTGKFTRTSAASFLDPNDLCLIQVTIINMKKLSGIYIADFRDQVLRNFHSDQQM